MTTPTDDLIAAAEDALEFLSGYVDVIDGDYGMPAPNRAMEISQDLRIAITRCERNLSRMQVLKEMA